MPRIATSLLRKAHALDRLLPPLLGVTRDLQSAANELRWLREHVQRRPKAVRLRELARLVKERARGTPLQYLLETEYFGDLELGCRKGVLIPRQDTASTVSYLAHLVRDTRNALPIELRLLDICTGSGCIPLLFGHELRKTRRDITYRMLGVDISQQALSLAMENLERLRREPSSSNLFSFRTNTAGKGRQGEGEEGKVIASFIRADILNSPFSEQSSDPESVPPLQTALNHAHHPQFWDILIANPPYISPSAYWKTTTRSVRGYEPTLALVPPPPPIRIYGTGQNMNLGVFLPWPPFPSWAEPSDMASSESALWSSSSVLELQQQQERGDTFYVPLLDTAVQVEAKIVLFEIADIEQAVRVARLRSKFGFEGVEIWRDRPDITSPSPSSTTSHSVVPEPQIGVAGNKVEQEKEEEDENMIDGIPIMGSGNARCVVFWTGMGASWLGKRREVSA